MILRRERLRTLVTPSTFTSQPGSLIFLDFFPKTAFLNKLLQMIFTHRYTYSYCTCSLLLSLYSKQSFLRVLCTVWKPQVMTSRWKIFSGAFRAGQNCGSRSSIRIPLAGGSRDQGWPKQDSSIGKVTLTSPEAEFMNVQFRWGFWACSNFESSQTWGFFMDREGCMVFYQVFLFLLYSVQ